MDLKEVNLFLESLTFDSEISFLEEAAHKDEIAKVAKEANLAWPSPDLAILKCTYAMIGEENLNKCTLPRKEVEKAMATLPGKALDFDHDRKQVCGTILSGKISGDKIIMYSSFFKSNFPDDYETVKDLFAKGNLKVSFEAWGTRKFREDGSYDLHNICFAGCGLLIKTTPAFPKASVMELAKHNRILEFASTSDNFSTSIQFADEINLESFQGSDEDLEDIISEIEDAKKLTYKERQAIDDGDFAVVKTVANKRTGGTREIRMFPIKDEAHVRNALARLSQATNTLQKLGISPETVRAKILHRAKELKMTDLLKLHKADEELEMSRFYVHDTEHIMRNMSQVECPHCKAMGSLSPHMIDYKKNKVGADCVNCSASMMCDMTPPAILTKKGRQIKSMAAMVSKGSFEEILTNIEFSDERVELSLEKILSQIPDTDNRFDLSDDDFAIVKASEDKKRKIRLLPIHDLAHLKYASIVVASKLATDLLNKLSISKDIVERKINRKVMTTAMKTLLEKYKKTTPQEVIQEVAKVTINRELTKEELEKAYSLIAYKPGASHADGPSNMENPGKKTSANPTSLMSSEVVEADEVDEEVLKAAIVKATTVEAPATTEDAKTKDLQAKLDAALAQIASLTKATEDAKVAEEAQKKADLIKARRDELGEVAKEMKDEDVLDETKYALAKKDAEIAALKAAKPAVPDLTKGSKDKSPEGPIEAARKRVDEIAFARNRLRDRNAK